MAMLRSIPNVDTIRPCDERETYAAWNAALDSKTRPTALILSRQNLPLLDGSSKEGVYKGAYVISKEAKKADYILIATGSEVALAVEAQKLLAADGIDVRVVSMPCWSYFDAQDKDYKKSVLSLDREKIVSVEMLSSFGWDKYAANHLSIDSFGKSAPAKDVINAFGFTADKVAAFVKNLK